MFNLKPKPDEPKEPTPAMNFCGFLDGSAGEHSMYSCEQGFGTVCDQMVARAGLEAEHREVSAATIGESGQWELTVGEGVESFDRLVLANNQPTFAADLIQTQLEVSTDPELTHPEVKPIIEGFCQSLRDLKKSSRYSLMLGFNTPLSDVPWDAAAVHGSGILQFMSRGAVTVSYTHLTLPTKRIV
eukprot:TRINITY_DN23709_c0_g1_i1.p1 TRINITY_DN23709_c0_g1~~TRINITY_DN23709_c0_g1_i1.p1  ORF type:complete len:186 (-),score=36.69 TRINITY_DN23709_c0_g1_i1:112-669(-)